MAFEKIGKDIIVEGCVQGVGFRPHVYRLARRFGIHGEVRNVGGAVRIRAGGHRRDLDAFVDALGGGSGPGRVERLRVAEAEPPGAGDFVVERSVPLAEGEREVSPDLPLCEECAAELARPGRRHRHAFNTCTACGPRFSIIRALPYDRPQTGMADFAMCPECAAEYADPADRRFHAETICCAECGPTLMYWDGTVRRRGEAAFELVAERLRRGGIALVKGIGGYHLACSPFSVHAVESLRRIKGRDHKPFAVMFPDPEAAEASCLVSADAREALRLPARPIVPLPLRAGGKPFAPGVLRGDAHCGCFLPYTPLHLVLLRQTGPLVMTSANASGSPIVFEDVAALAFLSARLPDIACMLFHDRPILRPVEDSVVEAGEVGFPRVLRRSRGYVPAPLPLPEATPALLAMGGDLKASFCLARNGRAYPSQYFGDLEDAASFANYAGEIPAFQALLAIAPEFVVCDRHPGYLSTRHAGTFGLPLVTVQHHHAHIASVMAECGLRGPVIGAAFDGTGHGDDGAVWGGEFLLCDEDGFRRLAHLDYIPLVGGDQAARDARQTAAAYLLARNLPLPDGLHPNPAILASAMALGIGCVPNSSMGRLFDAIAALLGVADTNDYEGRCAIALQRCAEAALRKDATPVPLAFDVEERGGMHIVRFDKILAEACACEPGRREAFALGFHVAIADMVGAVFAESRRGEGMNDAALSGGVFQNALLLRLCRDALTRQGFSVHCNRMVPPNDGGLALGQALVGGRLALRRKG